MRNRYSRIEIGIVNLIRARTAEEFSTEEVDTYIVTRGGDRVVRSMRRAEDLTAGETSKKA